jgi:hypothetical protein
MKLGPSRYAEAKEHLSTVLENRVQLGPTKGKGKASMQNVVILRANASSKQCVFSKGRGVQLKFRYCQWIY